MALRDIQAGEELWVDYEYNFNGGPKWFKEAVINITRTNPDFFMKINRLVTNGKSLDELEKELEDYLANQVLEIPTISEGTQENEKSS